MRQPHREGHVPPGETSTSPERPAQRLSGPRLAFDLAREIEQLRREESWQRGDRNAKTLVKEPPLRLTLTALKQGARLDEHVTEGPVTIHPLEGRLQVTVDGDPTDLPAGQILVLDAGTRHGVTAIEESIFLLTIGLLNDLT